MGNGKRESNGCTVHFNSILQLLIYKPQSINKILIKLEISKEASFFFFFSFFYSFVFLIFSFTFEHYTFFFLYSLNYYLITPPFTFKSIQHISLPGCFEIQKKKKKRREGGGQETGSNENNRNISQQVKNLRTHSIHSVNDFEKETALWSILLLNVCHEWTLEPHMPRRTRCSGGLWIIQCHRDGLGPAKENPKVSSERTATYQILFLRAVDSPRKHTSPNLLHAILKHRAVFKKPTYTCANRKWPVLTTHSANDYSLLPFSVFIYLE